MGLASSARGRDDGYFNGGGDGGEEIDVKSLALAVVVDGVDEKLACAERLDGLGELDGAHVSALSPAFDGALVKIRTSLVVLKHALALRGGCVSVLDERPSRINADDDSLAVHCRYFMYRRRLVPSRKYASAA